MARRSKKHKRSIQNPAVPINSATIMQYLGAAGSRSSSGVPVNWRSALTVAPVWQAVNIITGDISRIPALVKRATPDGRGEEHARGHSVYRLFRSNVGYNMTANIWVSRILGHALLYGNGYSLIERRGSRVIGLKWIHRDQVEPMWEDGKYFYLVSWDQNRDGKSGIDRVHPLDIFHVQGLTLDEFGGLSLIDYARNCIGRELSAEGFGDDFFANSAVPSGWFEHPAEMSQEAHERFLASVERRHRGQGNRHKVGILEEGMKWNPSGISPKDAMLLDLMRWGTKDVARFFNLPPSKLGDDSKINYNSLEQENKAYFDSSLGIWVSRLQCEANSKLFSEAELDDGYCLELEIDAWGKADTASRFAAYAVGIQWGIMSRNEVRLRENLNPYDGGDEYLTPLTHGTPSDDLPPAAGDEQPEQEETPDEPEETEPTSEEARAILYDLVRERLEAGTRLIHNASGRAAKRGGNFLSFLNELQESFGPKVEGKIAAAVLAVRSDPAAVTQRIFSESIERLLKAAECPADRLVSRVADAGESMRTYSQSLARELVYGGASNG